MEQIFPLMQPILTEHPPESSDWIHQIKYDGIRLLCIVQPHSTLLLTRNQKKRNRQYPEILQIPHHVQAKSLILDGEVICRSSTGKPLFSLVVPRDRSQNEQKIAQWVIQRPIEYHVFDLLMKDGKDLRKMPLMERLSLLHEIVRPNSWLHLVDHFSDGKQLFAQMVEKGWEGIVSKLKSSPYMGGKAHQAWFKTKVKQRITCFIGGVQMKQDFPNALLLGLLQNQQFIYIGKVAAGLSNRDFALLQQALPHLEQEDCPFLHPPQLPLPVKWLKPSLAVLIQYTEMTEEGLLRHPQVLGFQKGDSHETRI